GGTGGSGGCPGDIINNTCVYLADSASYQRGAARAICTGLGAGWDLCDSTMLCLPATLTYLGLNGCDCNGGSTTCACGSSANTYIHVYDDTVPYYIRNALIPNCDWSSEQCTDSVSETCGSPLCCN
ncbi:MAG: hypothetical protein JRI23_34430, partial [Deltaproteobacteria bacterium]|nr:hypothetical protein [Deltaproteobacteria bacterium]MBW2537396.1 hypothetical protein [Deltaproteobacteria bacterium]